MTYATWTLNATVVAPEPDRPLKPSEALRLGRLRYPFRTEGKFYDGYSGACALGAIAAGYGLRGADDSGYYAEALVPYLSKWTQFRISILNDFLHWPDHRISGWLEARGL